MAWREDISIGLPPERSDEPGDLRRDIVDELADHLGCAMKRELRKTDDEASARRAVLARFGNPARIAYRLWFDAMKEQIMNQRITLLTNIALAAACIVIAITAFAAMRQNAEMGAALIAKMETIGGAPAQTDASSVWAEATMRIVSDNDATGPIENCLVRIRGDMFNPGKSESLEVRTGADGTASFGPIRPGKYALNIFGPDHVQYSDSVILYPGTTELEPITWPSGKSPPAPVSFKVEMPDELRDHVAYFVCQFEPGTDDLPDMEGTWRREPTLVLLSPTGEAMVFGDPWPVSFVRGGPRPRVVRLTRDALRLNSRVEFDSGITYRLKSITACLPAADDSDPDLFDELTWQEAGQIVGTVGEPRRGTRVFREPEYVNNTIYRGEPERENVWTFEMPGEFEIALAKRAAERKQIENEAEAASEG